MSQKRRYKISIDPSLSEGEKLGMYAVAYTDNPAILTKGLAFNSIGKLQFNDKLKGRVAAPVLIPDLVIPRVDKDGEYEVVFSKEVIESLYEDFMLNKDKNIFNLDHVSSEISPSFILESWITIDPKHDKSFTKYGIEVPEGSLFFVSQFTDLEYFKREIVDKGRAAYSIEAFLAMKLKSIKNMSKEKFVSATTKDGVVINTDSDVMAVGDAVYTIDDTGKQMPVADGSYEFDNGITIDVAGGKITELADTATDITEEGLDKAATEVIQKAVMPLITELRNEIAALKVELSNQPAASQPKKDEPKPVALSAIEKVRQLTLKTNTKK